MSTQSICTKRDDSVIMNVIRCVSFMYAREYFNCYVQVMFLRCTCFASQHVSVSLQMTAIFSISVIFYPHIIILKTARIPFL